MHIVPLDVTNELEYLHDEEFSELENRMTSKRPQRRVKSYGIATPGVSLKLPIGNVSIRGVKGSFFFARAASRLSFVHAFSFIFRQQKAGSKTNVQGDPKIKFHAKSGGSC